MTLAELQAYIGGDHFDHIHPLKFSAVLQGTPLLLKALENVSIALMEGFPPPLAGLSFTFFGQNLLAYYILSDKTWCRHIH